MGGAPPLPLGSAPAAGNQSECSLWFGHSLVTFLGRCSAICGGPGRSPGESRRAPRGPPGIPRRSPRSPGNVPEHPAGRGPTWPGCPVGTPTRRGSETHRGSEGAPSTPSSYALSRGRVSAVESGDQRCRRAQPRDDSGDPRTTRVTNGAGGSCRGVVGELSGEKNFFSPSSPKIFRVSGEKKFFFSVSRKFFECRGGRRPESE